MTTEQQKLVALLKQLFQLDNADLDFGIYRILRMRRGQLEKFFSTELVPQVEAELASAAGVDRPSIEAAIKAALQQLAGFGMTEEQAKQTPKYKELEARLAAAPDVSSMAREVFSDLYTFFSRYYDDGDFMPMPRYKAGAYAIPYQGEEVKLHWANADQYYVKTTEFFTNFTALVPPDETRRLVFRVADAESDRDNTKSQEKRCFILREEQLVTEEDGALVCWFRHAAAPERDKDGGGKKRPDQKTLNDEAEAAILAAAPDAWKAALGRPVPEGDKTWLRRQLERYTKRNTSDYFIHKNLAVFLKRELDFFIQNEVMNLDDVQEKGAVELDRTLRRVRAMRKVAQKIIDWLHQVEDFQRRLFLKKKFVLRTDWYVSADRCPQWLLEGARKNSAQRREWETIYRLGSDSSQQKQSALLTADTTPLVSTAFVGESEKLQLIGELVDPATASLDQAVTGLLIAGHNLHALELLRPRYGGDVRAIYIDPPYNTNATEILYKNGYRHSTWLAMLEQLLGRGRRMLQRAGIFCFTIDDFELRNALPLLLGEFGEDNVLGSVVIRNNPQGRSTLKGFRVSHEYALFFAAGPAVRTIGRLERNEKQTERYDEVDEDGNAFVWENCRKTGTDSERKDRPKQYYPLYCTASGVRVPQMIWLDSTKTWEITEKPNADEVVVWPNDASGTERAWKWGSDRVQSSPTHIKPSWSKNGEVQVMCRNYPDMSGTLPSTWWADARYAAGSHGTNLLTEMFSSERVFDYPKSVSAVVDCLKVATLSDGETALDFFGGSGTTGHAVINLNRADTGRRRFVLVEMGDHFDTALLPRVLKATYSKEWKDGKPVDRQCTSALYKVIRLESYDDTLENIDLKEPDEAQQRLLGQRLQLHEDYLLHYQLDFESRASLLDLDRFRKPFHYQLKVRKGGVVRTETVDLVETFNYLLGLHVKHMAALGTDAMAARYVEGTVGAQKVLVVWRDCELVDDAKLVELFRKAQFSPRSSEFDQIWVNGDNRLENVRAGDEHWKVNLIEPEFHARMFDDEDL